MPGLTGATREIRSRYTAFAGGTRSGSVVGRPPVARPRFETIHNHTTYSFGIDDQEFMTAFECDEPADFMHLMLTLRESEASRYTERDTPIFVGRHVPVREALAALDGASVRAEA